MDYGWFIWVYYEWWFFGDFVVDGYDYVGLVDCYVYVIMFGECCGIYVQV